MSTRPDRFQGFPRGWFVIAFSDELKSGDAIKLNYFGQALALFRGEDGVARVLDGYCPHLGAHMGKGEVVGDTLRCPFHHWRFDAGGACVEIPYCEKIPAKARVRAWPVIERNGMIYVWHHPERAAPDFDVPSLPNHEAEGWLPWKYAKMRIKTHSKEIVENVVDVAHFAPVHGTHVDWFENEFDGHKAIQRTRGVAYPRGGGKDTFSLTATYYGPGYQISDMKGYLRSLLVNAHTMIDEDTLDLRFGVCIKPTGDAARNEAFQQAYIDNLTTGYLEDVSIWEDKLYREHPVLCAGDGQFIQLRRWYAGFYSSGA